MASPITEDEFYSIRRQIEEAGPDVDAWAIGYKAGRGAAKISIIMACKTFEDYKRISRAEHPPVKHSLRDEIEDLKKRVDFLENILEVDERKKTQLALELHDG